MNKTEEMFLMQDGPAIPMWLAERIHRVYRKVYPTELHHTLEYLGSSKGFGWIDVHDLFEKFREHF